MPPHQKRTPGFAALALALALVCAVGGGAYALNRAAAPKTPDPTLAQRAVANQATHAADDAIDIVDTPRVPATPKSDWAEGAIPVIYQTDPAWAKAPYAGEDIKTSGCGPTCLSMVYVGLTGDTSMDPKAMAAFSERNGFVQEGMTAWTFFSDGAEQLGISCEELPSWADSVVGALKNGKPLVFNVQPGDFTRVGHYIVATGLDADGRLIIHDPNSAERTAQTWDVQRVVDQSSNIWAFEVA